jgi:hypothetical protein
VEVKAAGIDTVAARARERSVRVVLVRNQVAGLDLDLDSELVGLCTDA